MRLSTVSLFVDCMAQNNDRDGYECLIYLTSPPVRVPARRHSSTLVVCQPVVVSVSDSLPETVSYNVARVVFTET